MQNIVGGSIKNYIDTSLFSEINLAVWDMNLLFQGIHDNVFIFTKFNVLDQNNTIIHELINRLYKVLEENEEHQIEIIINTSQSITREQTFANIINTVYQQ